MQGVKYCDCGVPAKHQVVKKEGPNHGKAFVGCGSYPAACKFFEWEKVSTSVPPPRSSVPRDVSPPNKRHRRSPSADILEGLSVSPVQTQKQQRKHQKTVTITSSQLKLMEESLETMLRTLGVMRGAAHEMFDQINRMKQELE